MRAYIIGDEPETPEEAATPQASYVLGEVYSVDGDDRMVRRRRRAVEREMAGMAAQAAEEDAIADSLNEPPDETLASAIEAAQEDHAAHVKLQLLQAEIDARRRDEADRVAQQWINEQHEQEIADSDAAALVSPNVVQSTEEIPGPEQKRKRRKKCNSD